MVLIGVIIVASSFQTQIMLVIIMIVNMLMKLCIHIDVRDVRWNSHMLMSWMITSGDTSEKMKNVDAMLPGYLIEQSSQLRNLYAAPAKGHFRARSSTWHTRQRDSVTYSISPNDTLIILCQTMLYLCHLN